MPKKQQEEQAPKKRGPKPKEGPKADVTTSLRVYLSDMQRLERCRRILACMTKTEQRPTDVWRAALITLEADLKAKLKAQDEARKKEAKRWKSARAPSATAATESTPQA